MLLKHKIISGVKWNTVGKISNQILNFVLSVILMRLLLPSDYGLLAMAMVFIGFATIFSEFGFSSALIQNQNINNSHKSSIFWLNIVIGSIFTFLIFILADKFASFYEIEKLTLLIKYLSFSFIISSFSIVPSALLQKEMNYSALNKIDVSLVILSGSVSVYLAFNGWGVMSLVFQYLTTQLLRIPLVFLASKWYPQLIFSKDSIKELFSYSAYLSGFNIINYWARKSDDLLIGKFMGADSLGIYSRAYSLMLLPISQVISLISNVMFPAMSLIQYDKERVKSIFLRVIQILAFITFPIMIGLIATADNFVLGIFGKKWSEVIPIIQILAFVGVIQTLSNPVGWIYTSQGKTKLMFWWGVFGSGSVIVAIIIGVVIGSIYSVAIAYLIVSILLIYPVIRISGKIINMKFTEVVKKVFPVLITSLIMSAVIYFAGLILPASISAIVKLSLQVILGMLIYFFIMWYFKIESFTNIKELISEQFNNFYMDKSPADKL